MNKAGHRREKKHHIDGFSSAGGRLGLRRPSNLVACKQPLALPGA